MGHNSELNSVHRVTSPGSALSFGSHPELSPLLWDRPEARALPQQQRGARSPPGGRTRQCPRGSARTPCLKPARLPPLAARSQPLPWPGRAASCGGDQEGLSSASGPCRSLQLPVPGGRGCGSRRAVALARAEAALRIPGNGIPSATPAGTDWIPQEMGSLRGGQTVASPHGSRLSRCSICPGCLCHKLHLTPLKPTAFWSRGVLLKISSPPVSPWSLYSCSFFSPTHCLRCFVG